MKTARWCWTMPAAWKLGSRQGCAVRAKGEARLLASARVALVFAKPLTYRRVVRTRRNSASLTSWRRSTLAGEDLLADFFGEVLGCRRGTAWSSPACPGACSVVVPGAALLHDVGHAARSSRSPSVADAAVVHESNSASRNGGAILFFTTLASRAAPDRHFAFLIVCVRRTSMRTDA